ncbi:hypothetical protein GCM10023085_11280 [Actinomadura viridis]|uniref:Uncharacterized protein n=1 Tax=Actinomadura viridis TaxID=58110 RepID=A0A931DRN1_9ACTN|nr:hypothetical protein [Actinomadura viridis]MBG6093504.1 hypothetical protein [Actinomadura viridis]
MTTVVLVLLCLAIAGRELYLASDKRLPRAQAELRELRAQVSELGRRHDALQAEVAETAERTGIAIPPSPPQPPPGSLHAAEPVPAPVLERLERLGERIERIERLESEPRPVPAAAGASAAPGSEPGSEPDRDARHALARSLDAVEQAVGELQREMLERLDREEGVVTGLLLSEEGEAEALLADAYERCSAEYGLRVRIRDQISSRSMNGEYWGTAYHLSGRRADALAEDLFTYARDMRDPRDPSALAALIAELAHLGGGGIARIGAFTAVRTANTLLCGLLPEDVPEGIEPWELAARIRELPDELRVEPDSAAPLK